MLKLSLCRSSLICTRTMTTSKWSSICMWCQSRRFRLKRPPTEPCYWPSRTSKWRTTGISRSLFARSWKLSSIVTYFCFSIVESFPGRSLERGCKSRSALEVGQWWVVERVCLFFVTDGILSQQAVHEGYLEDLVWPHRVSAKYEIHDVGIEKPTHHFMLEITSKPDTESKLEVYKQVYSHLTGKTCVFEYLDYTEGTELQRQMCPNIWPCDASAFPSYREKFGNQMQEFSEIKPAPLFAETSNNERNAIEVNQE